MEIQTATRKPFPVKVVQVTLQNIEEVAEWCKGTIEYRPTRMLGTVTDLPVIKIKSTGDNRGKAFEAALGCWVVELKGSFRSYNPAQFASSFDILTPPSLVKATDELELENKRLFLDAVVNEPGGDGQGLAQIYSSDQDNITA